MDDVARQVHQELREYTARGVATNNRPVLIHLNADTTWLLRVPYPRGIAAPKNRSHYNILIDPWLSGPQSDVASWFSTQWHVVESCVPTIAELEKQLQEAEILAKKGDPSSARQRSHRSADSQPETLVDAVVLSHEFTDHTHRATLLEINPITPVFATEKAADLVRSWKHFNQVIATPNFSLQNTDWRATSIDPLPSWIGISRVVTASDALYYHSAILIAFNIKSGIGSAGTEGTEAAEAIIYSPHGIVADDLSPMPKAVPPIKTLGLLHGLHDVGISFTKQLNLGAHNGLKVQRMCDAKYWIGTHDEVKKGGGFLAPFLRRTVIAVEEALSKERAEISQTRGLSDLAVMKSVKFVELRSGESLLME